MSLTSEDSLILKNAIDIADHVFKQQLHESGLDYATIVIHINVPSLHTTECAKLHRLTDHGYENHYEYTTNSVGYFGDECVFRVYFRIGTNLEGGRLVYVEGDSVQRLDTRDQICDWNPKGNGILFVRND